MEVTAITDSYNIVYIDSHWFAAVTVKISLSTEKQNMPKKMLIHTDAITNNGNAMVNVIWWTENLPRM